MLSQGDVQAGEVRVLRCQRYGYLDPGGFHGRPLVAVRFPLVKRKLCAPRRALLVCFAILVTACLKNMHVFWTRDEEYYPVKYAAHNETIWKLKKVCGRPKPYDHFENNVRPWLAFTLVSAVPFLVILASNTVIVWTLITAHKQRRKSLQRCISSTSETCQSPTNGGGGSSAEDEKKRFRVKTTFTQTSLMCIFTSVAFLVCVTPSIVLTMWRTQWLTYRAYYVARAVSHQLACVNHAINFFLYCMTGQRFRGELVSLLQRKRSSISGFEASTKRYYLDMAAARRSTQSSTSTSVLAMQTVNITAPVAMGIAEEQSSDD